MQFLKLFERALSLHIGVAQSANAELLGLVSEIHPLQVHAYPSGREHNGWVIPRDWRVRRARITHKGKPLFDGTVHPLAVAGSSSSFNGIVSKAELDRHVFFNRDLADSFVFHCIYNYRPWETHWGFCIPWTTYRTWPDGDYEVDLETEFRPGQMLVGEFRQEGDLADTIVFNAHTCHPCQANDDMSGVFVIAELFARLASRRTRYTYRGILAPEHFGTVFYVADLPDAELARLKLGCFVEMVGSDTPLALQQSFTGRAIIDRVAQHVLEQVQPALTVKGFRQIVGNDETVWEAPGIEIPTISISRFPYLEYHTSADDMRLMSESRLDEALAALEAIVDAFERDCTIERRFRGLVALSNPKYGLYMERPDPVVSKNLSAMDLRFGEMQDSLPRYFDGRHTVFEIAERWKIPFGDVRAYVGKWEQKGLVALRPVQHIADYSER